MPEYRVDFRRPIGESGKFRKVFTFTIADSEDEAKRKVLKYHPGSKIVAVTLKGK